MGGVVLAIKHKTYRNRTLLYAARGETCVLCGADDGTIVAAHLPGSIYGMDAGMGEKCADFCVAHLCSQCHSRMDTEWRRDTQIRMKALCLTLERLFANGRLHT